MKTSELTTPTWPLDGQRATASPVVYTRELNTLIYFKLATGVNYVNTLKSLLALLVDATLKFDDMGSVG